MTTPSCVFEGSIMEGATVCGSECPPSALNLTSSLTT